MLLSRTQIDQVWTLDLQPHTDPRGWFARAWCSQELEQHGLCGQLAQISLAYTHQSGTVRGLHHQRHPHWEEKIVRCVRGAAWVVAVDLRPASPTHRTWVGLELSADNRRAMYVGQGCAQGYQTLEDETELLYQMSKPYHPASSTGFRYDDPAFGISWPRAVSRVGEKDTQWESYTW